MHRERIQGNCTHMKNSICCFVSPAGLPVRRGPRNGKGQRHEFVIANSRPRAVSRCRRRGWSMGPYGLRNAGQDNEVARASHYMADFHGYAWVIGADKARRRRDGFLATECLGNGRKLFSPTTPPETVLTDRDFGDHAFATKNVLAVPQTGDRGEPEGTHLRGGERAPVRMSMGEQQAVHVWR